MSIFRIVVLGTRGSAALEGACFSDFGGSTSCIYVEVDDELLILDAGTGFMLLPQYIKNKKEIHVLISHPHLDHIMGLIACPLLYNPEIKINLYARRIDGRGIKDQLNALMTTPIWPVSTANFLADISYNDCNDSFFIGNVKIMCEDGWHPGGATVYRLEHLDKSLVYATDYEINDFSRHRLEAFSNNCSLLLCDGQYTREELKSRKSFGHSAWEDTVDLASCCGAERLGIIHHAPLRTDEHLNEMQELLNTMMPNSFFAKIHQEIKL